jgi:starch synthase
MPSRYEPCGLNQLYSLKYGTVPVVRATGGLVDTVSEGVTGFVFQEYTAAALEQALRRAVETYWQNQPAWRQLVEAGMQQDWSWSASARQYEIAYAAAGQRRREHRDRLKAQR